MKETISGVLMLLLIYSVLYLGGCVVGTGLRCGMAGLQVQVNYR
jgi:hypothetical protein